MNQLQLYINDQLVDLNDDNPIALTFQINNLAEVQNQQGNTSNQFKLPLTQRNRQVLGFPDDITFTTNAPYQQFSARLIQDGLEIIPYGIAELNSIEQNNANITVLSGNVDFFDAIDGKLYDMGDSTSQWSNFGQNLVWQPYDHTWNLENVVNSQTKTLGWIYPVVDYGFINGQDFSSAINVHNMRPGFFIKTAIDLLLKSAGYKGKGSLLTEPLYPLLIAQFSNDSWEHGTDYQNQIDIRGMSATNTINQSFLHNRDDTNKGFINFGAVIADPSGQYNGTTTFTATEPENFGISVIIPKFYFDGHTDSKHPSSINISIYLNESSLSDITYDFTNGFDEPRDSGSGSGIIAHKTYGTQTLSASADMDPGDKISIRYEFIGDQPAFFNIFKGATFTITSQKQSVKFGQTIQCERIFPDISQKDLLKDTLQRFGIICQTDNAGKTISFNSLRDIVNNIPQAKDWTSKCLNQGKQINYQLGNYAQVNTMKYKDDDNVTPIGFADAQINVNDSTLAATADLFQSQFAPTLNRSYITGAIAQIKMIDDTSDNDDFSISVSPRILIDQKSKLPAGKTVTFTDGTSQVVINDIISTPYFYKPDGNFNLCFGDMPGIANTILPGLKTKYYPELQKILTQTKKVVRYLLLTPRDILELDLLIPIYLQQDNTYYYINKVDSWRKGQPCKVELVKLG
ncbi:MAG TPA: hypothetical protein VGM63_22690 [Mucilaginibacter sp.]